MAQIADDGRVGDGRIRALVACSGAIEFLCRPRSDSNGGVADRIDPMRERTRHALLIRIVQAADGEPPLRVAMRCDAACGRRAARRVRRARLDRSYALPERSDRWRARRMDGPHPRG